MVGADARLSIVVPFYGVEKYIVACLESLQRQTFEDFEVILVDDGSRDGSRDLAEAFCATDPRFRIVTQENQGLGPARNTGVKAAQGRFLTFVDSDDLVPRHAYERLVRTLESTGSDFAAGDARRFNALGVKDSWVHRDPFETERLATNVREFPALGLDRMAWNKVFDRRFWDTHGFEFPAMLYEDYPVTMRAHVLATSVDLLEQPVYYWRERDGGEPSITQRRWELPNIRDRVASAEMVLSVVSDQPRDVAAVVEGHLLHIDLGAVVAALHQVDADESGEVLALARRLLAGISAETRKEAIPFDRIQAHLVEAGALDELARLVDYRAQLGTGAPVITTGGIRPRRSLALPFHGEGVVPAELYRVPEDQLELVTQVVDGRWESGRLHLDLAVFVDLLTMTEDSRIKVWLEDESGRRGKVEVSRHHRGHLHVARDLSGCHVVIDPRRLFGSEAPRPGFWRLMVEVRTQRTTRSGPVTVVSPGRARWPSYDEVTPALWAQPHHRGVGFGLWFRPPGSVVTDCVTLVDEIEISGVLDHDGPVTSLALQLTRDESEQLVFAAEELDPHDGLRRFRARVPARELMAHGDHDDPVEERTVWIPRLLVDGDPRVLSVHRDCGGAVSFVGSRAVQAARTIHGNLALTESYAHPVVTDVAWDGERVVLSGILPDDAGYDGAVGLRFLTPLDPVEVDPEFSARDGLFQLRIDPRQLIEAATGHETQGGAPVAGNPWHLFLTAGERRVRPVMARSLAWRLPGQRRVEDHAIRVLVDRGEVVQVLVL